MTEKSRQEQVRQEETCRCGGSGSGRCDGAGRVDDEGDDASESLESGQERPVVFVYWEEECFDMGSCRDGHDMPFIFAHVRQALRFLRRAIRQANEFLELREVAVPETGRLVALIDEVLRSPDAPPMDVVARIMQEHNAAYADTNPYYRIIVWGDLGTVLSHPHAFERIERCGGGSEPWWREYAAAVGAGTFNPDRDARHREIAQEAIRLVYSNIEW